MTITSCGSSTWKGITILQFRGESVDTLPIHGSDAPMKDGRITISELGEGGSVNALKAENACEDIIFLGEGDILIGAKQNRCLNLSVLLAPHSVTVLPVSCVEHGRWSSVSRSFSKGATVTPPDLRRKMHSERVERMSQSHVHEDEMSIRAFSQHRVWAEVDSYLDRHQATSDTSSLSAAMERVHDLSTELQSAVPVHPEASGFAIFLNGRMTLIENFHHRDIYRDRFQRQLTSTLLDWMPAEDAAVPLSDEEALSRVQAALARADEADSVERPSVGLGRNRYARTESEDITVLEYEGVDVHRVITSRAL